MEMLSDASSILAISTIVSTIPGHFVSGIICVYNQVNLYPIFKH
ncbi:MAG: hypothetical protein ACLU9N_03905 [Clostridia bacterium]